MKAIKSVSELKKGDILLNNNHGFEIEIRDIGKKNTRYINLETGEKVKSFTSKFNFMLREGVFSLQDQFQPNPKFHNELNGELKCAYFINGANGLNTQCIFRPNEFQKILSYRQQQNSDKRKHVKDADTLKMSIFEKQPLKIKTRYGSAATGE